MDGLGVAFSSMQTKKNAENWFEFNPSNFWKDFIADSRGRKNLNPKELFQFNLEMLSFQASKVPYDLALDIIDDAGDGDCLLMLIVREDMYSKQDAEVLLKSYGQLVKDFAESPGLSFAEPDMFEKAAVERSLTFGRGL